MTSFPFAMSVPGDLADPESLARVLLDQVTEGVTLASNDGTILYANPASGGMHGAAPTELVGRDLFALVGGAERAKDVAQALRTDRAWSGGRTGTGAGNRPVVVRTRISSAEILGQPHWLCLEEDVTAGAEAARALAEERTRLAVATQAAEIGIWDWDVRTGRMTYTDIARRLAALPPEGEIGIEDVRRTVHPEDYPRTSAQSLRALDPALRDRSPYEYRVVHPDGSVRWVLARGEAMFEDGSDGPHAVRFLGTIQDITARRELEEAERQAVQQLRLALQASRMGVWDLDLASRRLTGSPQLHRLLGFPEEAPIAADEALGRCAPGERDRIAAEAIAALGRGESSIEAGLLYDHPEKGQRWLRLRYEVLPDATGRLTRLLGVVSDETERRQAELQVRASEEELRALADALPLLVSFVDRGQRYRFMNRAHEAWFGQPREAMLGRTIPDLLGERAYAPRRPHIEAALRGEATRLEVVTPGRAGATRDTEVHYIPRRDSSGGVDGIYAVVLDLTEQKAAQRALQQAREAAEREAARTGAILGQLAEGVMVADTSGRITFVNEAAARLHGESPLGVGPDLRSQAYALAAEDGRPLLPDELPLARAALFGESIEEVRWKIRRPDGREVLAVGAAKPILTPEGTRVGAVLTFRDDTARARAEAQLLRLNQDLEAEVAQRTAERDRIWQNSTELMSIIGFDGRRRAINPAWMQVLGHDEETLLGSSFMNLTHSEDQPRLRTAVEGLRRGERMVEFESRLRHKDGSYRTISWTGVPGADVFYAIGRDVTAQRQAEEALRQSQKMEALGQLTGGIAHDFNNLLQAVQGSFALILRRPGDEARVRMLAEQGIQATRRGGSLAAQLLAFSRSQKLETQAVAVGQALLGMQDLLRRSIGPLVDVTTDAPDPDLHAEVDPTQLEMAVLNLAINARDAMPGGGTIAIRAEPRSIARDPALPSGDYVAITVHDTGTGMPPEVAARAFEPFFTTKGLGRGTGLGLSQVYGMARQAGGTARLDSDPGEGTTVTILLQRSGAQSDVAGLVPDARRPDAPAMAGATILVVDDDKDVRRWLVSALGMMGHRLVEAEGGAEGLAALSEAPDLMIVDYAMPGMTGVELIRRVRELQPDLPVILATGYADTGAVEEVADPALVILRKPFELEELEAVLRACLPAGG